MLVKQWRWYPGTGWGDPTIPIPGCHLVLAFGTRARIQDPDLRHILDVLRGPAPLVGCASVNDGDSGGTIGRGLIVTAVRFERAQVQMAVGTAGLADSFTTGRHMAAQLDLPGLRHLFIFTEGQREGGSELIRGIRSGLHGGEAIPGGLVCAGTDFSPSWLMVADGAGPILALALGLHGMTAPVSGDMVAGWVPFGPTHQVSKAHDSVLRELEGADGA